MASRPEYRTAVNRVVEEAIATGMETSLRDPILEGVEREQAMPVEETRRVPIAALFVGLSFVTGYLLGRRLGST